MKLSGPDRYLPTITPCDFNHFQHRVISLSNYLRESLDQTRR